MCSNQCVRPSSILCATRLASSFPFPLLDLINLDNPILLLMCDPIDAVMRGGFDIIGKDTGDLVR
jgi:hypothetical protein